MSYERHKRPRTEGSNTDPSPQSGTTAPGAPTSSIFVEKHEKLPSIAQIRGIGNVAAAPRSKDPSARPLNIILVAEPFHGQTEEQRREVRAQAMRDYHKRKRRVHPRSTAPLRQRPSQVGLDSLVGSLAFPIAESRGLHKVFSSISSHSVRASDIDYSTLSGSTSSPAIKDWLNSIHSQNSGATSIESSSSARDARSTFGSSVSDKGVHASFPEFDRWQFDTSNVNTFSSRPRSFCCSDHNRRYAVCILYGFWFSYSLHVSQAMAIRISRLGWNSGD
jgi:hypothetical protein